MEQAQTVIANGNYTLMTKSELYETGFADVSAHNWMWGEDVTIENTTGLASFFGQVDIHTYSYAAAGDIKGIDSYLYDQIAATGWDARLGWFRSGSEKFPYCPDGKFFCPKTKDVTALGKVDRNWLCDNVVGSIPTFDELTESAQKTVLANGMPIISTAEKPEKSAETEE